MKKTILISLASVLLAITSCTNSSNSAAQITAADSTKAVPSTQQFSLDTTKLKSGATFYHCEMNLEILSDKPGSCPTCGMELTAIKKQ